MEDKQKSTINYSKTRNKIKKYLKGKVPDQWIWPMAQEIIEIVRKNEQN